jgi:uncharacterized protein (DUF1800 family)
MPLPKLPPLDALDPHEAWQPWRPSASQPWDLKWAGHLLRRAGFGSKLNPPIEKTSGERPEFALRMAITQGLPATLDALFKALSQDELQRQTGQSFAGREDAFELRGWWLYWMQLTADPLREKLTLFWHNHFATSIAKVGRTLLMYQQNELIRQHALGKFGPFLLDMSRDPAMLLWLDSNSNVKGKPNENYAREVMELFSLGVGNYAENDIREAARAFTGWQTDGERFDFNADDHDDGEKTVLGQKGKWNGNDVVRIVLEQPAAAQFLVRKLYRFFVNETAQPSDRFLEPLAAAFRKSDYDIAAVVRIMLASRHFFSGRAYRQRIKSPAEFVAGTVRALVEHDHPVDMRVLARAVDSMGQELFAPPNVKGWVGGRTWLNTATILARHNFSQTVTSSILNVEPLLARSREPRTIVGHLADLLLQGDITLAMRTRLERFVADGRPQGPSLDQRVREAAHAIMTMPEYQLC